MCVFNVRRLACVVFVQCALYYLSGLTNASPMVGEVRLKVAKENRYPFVVAIVTNNPNITVEENQICGGSLIKLNLVLTAAHCVENMTAKDLKVVVGSVDLRSGKQYDVESWITYDEWVLSQNHPPPKEDNDIAVIKLAKNVDSPTRVGTLSKRTSSELRGSQAMAVGWGATSKTNHPRLLRKTWLKILKVKDAEDEFEKAIGEKLETPDNYFITQSKPRVILKCGDSGSPLLRKVFPKRCKIIGVAVASCPKSLGWDDMRRLNAHISIDPYRDFIKHVIDYF